MMPKIKISDHDMKVLDQAFEKLRRTLMTPRDYSNSCDEYDEDDDLVEKDMSPKYCQWGTSDGKIFMPSSKTVNKLTPGVYEIDMSPQIGLYFEKIPVKTEGLLRFPDTNSDKVVGEIQKFWDRENVFREYKISYKRGIILYGPPGSGKSCTVQLIMQDVVQRQGVVLEFYEPNLFISGMRVLRQIQPETPVVVIMEDIDSILENYNESSILNILDGVNEMDKVVFLATTNYPDKLGHRIMNRPSRFDKRFRIGFPSDESRRIYFEHLIGAENFSKLDINIDKWVEDTKEFSIAHLKELFVAVVILGDNYKEALKTLRKMREDIKDKDYEATMGFGTSDKPEDYYD
jgi:GTPase SAR1 family protein